MQSIKVCDLKRFCDEQIRKGNALKAIMISSDDEGNDFHELLFGFTDNTEDIKEFLWNYTEEEKTKIAKNYILLG